MLDWEPGLSLRKLAGRLGMTPPRLCQVLNLLKLTPVVRRAIAALPPMAHRQRVTEYSLRRIAAMAPSAQIKAFSQQSRLESRGRAKTHGRKLILGVLGRARV